MSDGKPKPGSYASPPCFMHTLDGHEAPSARDETEWRDVMRWRKAERARLIEERLSVSASARAAMSEGIAGHLDAFLGDVSGRVVSLYWPFRGEPDLRGWMPSLVDRGARIALPVVVRKHHPLAFRAYAPGDRLERGIWNIPVPADGADVVPDIVIAPVVGFDPHLYRLGYGGGFYDRTLAILANRPTVVGIGYDGARIATIYPKPHDIALGAIVTESGRAA